VSLALATTGLVVITNPSSPMLTAKLASLAMVTSLISPVASTLTHVETPPLLTISSAPLITAHMTPSTIITTKPIGTSSSGITRSLGVIEVKKEFITSWSIASLRA